MNSLDPFVIGIDWGTTSFRAYVLAPGGQELDRVSGPYGILNIAVDGYREVFERECGHWLDRWPSLPVVSCGMVGSRSGWQEASYLTGSPGIEDLAVGLVRLAEPDYNIHIVPGLLSQGLEGGVDVMRGEETLLAGALAAGAAATAMYCLPGTHSKWVKVRNGKIKAFSTFLTGEAFAWLRDNSILSPLLNDASLANELSVKAAFAEGVDLAKGQLGLLNQVFSIRASLLAGRISEEALLERLSGLVIGAELTPMQSYIKAEAGPVVLIASGIMGANYQAALSCLGHESQLLDAEECCRQGLAAIHCESL